jgi:hypothetical protein
MARVKVKSYDRYRNGRDEHVNAHTRRFPKPRQMTLNFDR